MKRTLVCILSCMLFLSACSKKVLTYNPEPEAELFEVNNKEEVTLVFFNAENANDLENHLAIYKRFAEAFANTDEVHVLNVNTNNIIEFKNYGYFYFQNNGKKLKSGMILSNGVDKPVIETNSNKYIKTYENYFKVPFNDKVYYSEMRKTEIAERQKKSNQQLKATVKIDQNYATQLIKNSSSSYYSEKAKNLHCLSGKVIIQFFEDSTKTIKGAVRMETLYDNNGLTRRETVYVREALFSENIYYRNSYGLIDSIVKIDNKGSRSKSVFKYGKRQYSIISVDEEATMISNVYYLNDGFQCIKNETMNGSGDTVSTTFFSYDNRGRITEETNNTSKMIYKYKSDQDDFYSSIKLYDIKNNTLLSESIRQEENGRIIFMSKNSGKLLSKTISLNNSIGCIKMIYTYDTNNKISDVCEYFYEN